VLLEQEPVVLPQVEQSHQMGLNRQMRTNQTQTQALEVVLSPQAPARAPAVLLPAELPLAE
jgi:hypothetical protein